MGVPPFEIIAAPFEVYLAPLATAFPDIADAPVSPWLLLGTSGNKNYSEDGITVAHEQTVEEFRPLGLTAARKAFRTEESLVISFEVADVSANQYAKIINDAAVTDTAAGAGTGGQLSFALMRGLEVATFAVLMRGDESAEGDGFNTQYELPMAYDAGNPEVVWKKGEPAMLAIELRVLWDTSEGFGRYRSQDAAPV